MCDYNSSIKSADQYEITAKLSSRCFFDNNNQYLIPFLQRSYQWETKQLELFIKDLYRLENNECSSLGEITLFTENSNNTSIRTISIWDGQQRIMTCYLFLVAMRDYIESNKNNLLPEKQFIANRFINTINDYIFRKEYELSEKELHQIKINNNKILKIRSNHYPDNNVLIDIFNKNLDKSNILYTINDEKKYSCNICGSTYKKFGENMITHLMTHNNDKTEKSNDNLKKQYKLIENLNKEGYIADRNLHPLIIAYEYLYEQIKIKFDDSIHTISDISPYERLLSHFLDNWLHEERMCKTIEYAIQSFEQLNARGKSLENQDMLRSLLISKVDESYAKKSFKDINDIFEFASKYKISKNRDLTISLLFNLANNKFNHNGTILDIGYQLFSGNVNENINKIKKYIELLKELEEFLENNNYGTIIKKDVMGDILSNVVVPCYIKLSKNKKKFNKILEIIACFQILTCTSVKNIQTSKTQIKEFADDIFNNNYEDDTIISKLIDLINNIPQIKKNINELESTKEDLKIIDKLQHIYKMLYFIECRKIPNGTYYKSEDFDIEHIMPKHNNNNIYINRIGNLTLFESQNSENHKGNRSLKDKHYSEKIKQYKKSHVQMTKEISDKYSHWDESKIQERTNELINFMTDEIKKILDKEINHSEKTKKQKTIEKVKNKQTKKSETYNSSESSDEDLKPKKSEPYNSSESEEELKPKKIVKKIELSDEKPKKKSKPIKKAESSSSESDSSSDSSSESESSSEDLKPKKKLIKKNNIIYN